MNSYTEEEIRAAAKAIGCSETIRNAIIVQLNLRDDHSHDFADDDTILVRELRDAIDKRGASRTYSADLLRDISRHRENFEQGSVVQDPEGNIWKLKGNPKDRWFIFGSVSNVDYYTPRRPLKLLGVDARRG